jgi:hypothetical protein
MKFKTRWTPVFSKTAIHKSVTHDINRDFFKTSACNDFARSTVTYPKVTCLSPPISVSLTLVRREMKERTVTRVGLGVD